MISKAFPEEAPQNIHSCVSYKSLPPLRNFGFPQRKKKKQKRKKRGRPVESAVAVEIR
jgi:hypothetical protein